MLNRNNTDGTMRWGTLSRIPISRSDNATDSPAARLIWYPSPRIASELPEGFRLEISEFGNLGHRRYVPACTTTFVLASAQAGLAIIANAAPMDAEARRSYRTMHLLFQQASQIRECLIRNSLRAQDLLVEKAVRWDNATRTILPTDIGFDSMGSRTILGMGRAAALSRGVENPSEATIIRFGILEAARQTPVETSCLNERDAKFWLRMALFDLGPAEGITAEVSDEIVFRLLKALEHHLECPATDFRRWFFKTRHDIIRTITKGKSADIVTNSEEVRQVLLERTFDSFAYVGQCVSALMHDVSNLITPILRDQERLAFDSLYKAEPWLAGIPLLILQPYLHSVREAVIEYLDDPTSATTRGVLLRALHIHGEMVSNRRRADRELKRNGGRRTWNWSERDNFRGLTPAQLSPDLVERCGFACVFCGESDQLVFVEVTRNSNILTVRADCNNCVASNEFECEMDALQRQTRSIDR